MNSTTFPFNIPMYTKKTQWYFLQPCRNRRMSKNEAGQWFATAVAAEKAEKTEKK